MQRRRRRLDRARRQALRDHRALHRRVPSAPDHQQDRLADRPPYRRSVADGGRALARRKPRQRDHPAAFALRPAAHDPKVQPASAGPRGHDQHRVALDRVRRLPVPLHRGAAERAHLGRHGIREDDAAERALGRDPEQRAHRHYRRRRGAPDGAATRPPARGTSSEHRGRGSRADPRPPQELPPHAPRPDHRRRGSRRGSARHAPGDEHGP